MPQRGQGHTTANRRPALLAQAGPGTALVPFRNRTYLGVVTDDEGFQQPRRPEPRGVIFDELPVTHQEATQKPRRNSKFAVLIDDEEDAIAADISVQAVASASG